MKKISLIVLLIWSVASIAQKQDTILPQEDQKISASSPLEDDFVSMYQLQGKKPIMARITDEFEMRSAPACASEKTGIVIPQDSVVFVYKFYPNEKCWAAIYQGHWGFITDSKVFPISSRTRIPNTRYDVPPKLKTSISPKYPKEAKKKGIKGKVYIKVYIDETGKATKTIIIKGIPELNQATIDAVMKAKYKPAIYKKKKVGVWVTLFLDYK